MIDMIMITIMVVVTVGCKSEDEISPPGNSNKIKARA